MSTITSLAYLKSAIERVGGRPKVLEALWDGDTQGWYLGLSLYVERGVWPLKRTECHFLGSVVLGTDLRLFTGQVPPWPEVELVKAFVAQTQATYGLTLYLPSEEPDDECLRWTERAHARACLDCGKLGKPTDSPYLPKDICYNCHLRREQRARLQLEQAYDGGINWYVYGQGQYRKVAYATQFESFVIAPYVDPALVQGFLPDTIHVVTLEQDALLSIQAGLADALAAKLAAYEPAEKDTPKSRFYDFVLMPYQGVTYELEVQCHALHREISTLFHGWETTRNALLEGASYKLYFKHGITYRDEAVLRYLTYPTPSPKPIHQLLEQYQGILTEQQVQHTLAKLEAMHCLEIVASDVTITQTGRNIV